MLVKNRCYLVAGNRPFHIPSEQFENVKFNSGDLDPAARST